MTDVAADGALDIPRPRDKAQGAQEEAAKYLKKGYERPRQNN